MNTTIKLPRLPYSGRMTMKEDQYNRLVAVLESHLSETIHRWISAYEIGDFPRADKVKDLNKRFRWDIYWTCISGTMREEHRNLLDSAIDTALARVLPKINRRY